MKTSTRIAPMAVAPVVGCRLNQLHRKPNRVAFGAGAMAAALLAGATVAWSQAAHTTAQEREASLEADKCERVVQVLKDLLNGLSPWEGRSPHVTAETTCRHILDETAKRIGEDLKGHPDLEAELRTTLGFVYNELDDGVKAEEMHRQALELRRTLAARPEHAPRVPATTPVTRPVRNSWHGDEDPTVAASIYNLGQALLVQGRHSEAKAMFEEALALNRGLLRNEDPRIANCLDHLSVYAVNEGKLAEAEAMAQEALGIRRRQFGNDHWDVALSLRSVARVHMKKGELAEAASAPREALALNRRFFGESHLEVAVSCGLLADILIELGRNEDLPEAEELIRIALPSVKRVMGQDHSATRDCQRELASILRKQGRDAEAELLLTELATNAQGK